MKLERASRLCSRMHGATKAMAVKLRISCTKRFLPLGELDREQNEADSLADRLNQEVKFENVVCVSKRIKLSAQSERSDRMGTQSISTKTQKAESRQSHR
jgi:hypothetical protein